MNDHCLLAPMLAEVAEVVVEMRKYGHNVPEGLRFLLVGRGSGVDVGDSESSVISSTGALPLPRRNPHSVCVIVPCNLPVPVGASDVGSSSGASLIVSAGRSERCICAQ